MAKSYHPKKYPADCCMPASLSMKFIGSTKTLIPNLASKNIPLHHQIPNTLPIAPKILSQNLAMGLRFPPVTCC